MHLAVLLALALLTGCGLPQAQPAPAPPPYDPADLEGRVLEAVNVQRRQHGAPPIVADPALAAIARGHSEDMLDRGFTAHRTPDGTTPADRAARAGYFYRHFGENLFRGRLYDTRSVATSRSGTHVAYRWHSPESLAALVADEWMRSPTHRENMLARRYERGGAGVAMDKEGEVLVTLNLSAR